MARREYFLWNERNPAGALMWQRLNQAGETELVIMAGKGTLHKRKKEDGAGGDEKGSAGGRPRKLNLHQAQIVEEVLGVLFEQSGAQVTLRFNIINGQKVYGVESDGVSASRPTLKPLLDEFPQLFDRPVDENDHPEAG